MGACTVHVISRAKDIRTAFRDAYNEAREEYGYDPYSGTIATCDLTKDATRLWKSSGKTLREFIEEKLEDDSIDKREVWGVEEEPGKFHFFGWAAE